MLHVRFTEIVLGLFIVLYALKNCSVRAHQDMETIGERHMASEESLVSVGKEFVDGFGGRKMGRHEVDGEIMSNAKFQDQANHQVEESKAKASVKRLSSRPVRESNGVESQGAVEAAKEIINLMNKDYKGLEKPRQKPPINNHIPRN